MRIPEEFRRDVIAVARKGEASVRQVAKDFGISEACLHRWLKIADREDGVDSTGPRGAGDQSAELREAHKRIKLLEQEAEVMRRAVGDPPNTAPMRASCTSAPSRTSTPTESSVTPWTRG